MTVQSLCERLSLTAFSLPEADREITGVYIGDLLSWVMGRAQNGDAWITIMSNINVIAVASLADTACVILAEDVTLPEDCLTAAQAKGINVLGSKMPAYETACALKDALL